MKDIASVTGVTNKSWRARYAAARAALNDLAALSDLWRQMHQMDTAAPPAAHALAGADALRKAHHVGLLTGSFNPLTRAHIFLAQAARQAGGLDAMVWGCAVVTVDKERVVRASLPDRLAQLGTYTRATSGNALVLLNRGLYVDEATALRTQLDPQADLAIVAGFDKVVQIFDPRYYANRDAALAALFAQARLLVAPRDGSGAPELAALLARPENRPFARFVTLVDIPPQFARDSSTEARELAAQMRSQPVATRRAALARLLPPEGTALACETGAYMAAASPDPAADPYIWRSRWLAALAAFPAAAVARAAASLPPLSRLVTATHARTTRGKRLRQWLDDPHPSLDDLIHLFA